MVRFILSICPFVHGCFGLVNRWSMLFFAQQSSKAWAEELSSHLGLFDLGVGGGTGPWYRELDAVVGENRMDLVGHGRDEIAKKVGGHLGGCFLLELDKGKLRRAVDGYEEMELALFCPDFGNVDMEEADQVGP